MDSEEGEFVLYGEGGNVEDVQFDEIVGSIENFMVNLDQKAILDSLPPLSTVASEHERREIHNGVLKRLDAEMDAYVLGACKGVTSLEDALRILESRKDEVSEDVLDFISEGFLDYASFVEMWRNHADVKQ